MKHLVRITLLAFTFCLHISLHAAVPLRWTVETSRATPATFEAYQGETIHFEADLQSVGKPLEMSGLAEFFWQTNGMGSAYWETTAAVNSNRLSAVFTPEMDVGARVYNCFIGVPGTIYHAAFQLRLRPSPGALPNVLPLPVPVIDFAKVRVLNPPWSGGGGGGVDTNAVIDIIHETVSGSARSLPKYLHERYFDDSYPNEAQEYYRSRGNGKTEGGCSSVRDGGFLYRNFDYPFDDRAEFVVHMSSGPARFASVGIAQVGTNLTEQSVTSGKPSRLYKALPGATVDGINENGVSCEINVVGGAPAWDGGASPALHPLAAVRWVLDNATNALQAATYIASHIAFPQGWTQNFHYMIADETSTYIVENGTAYPSGGTGVSPVSVLTNFRLYPTRDTTGEGQERYDALASGANITSQWWTLTYKPAGYRASDLPGITGEALTQLFNYWGNNPRESHRGERFGTMTWWQTVHTSVYDITNRVLRIAVQETDDWYVFAIPGGTGVSPVQVRAIAAEVVAPVASDLEMKIDRTGDMMNGELDMDYNDLSNVGSMNVSSLTVEDDLDVESADVRFGGALTVDGKSTLGEVSAEQIDATHLVASDTVKAWSSLQVGQTDVMQELGGKIGKVAAATNGNFAVFSNGSVADGGLSPGNVVRMSDLSVVGRYLGVYDFGPIGEATARADIAAGDIIYVNMLDFHTGQFARAKESKPKGSVITLFDFTGIPRSELPNAVFDAITNLTDRTLTSDGRPADARVTGDALASRVPYSGATKDVDLGYRKISSSYAESRVSLDPYGFEIANTNGTFAVRYNNLGISSSGASAYGMEDFHLSFPFGKTGDIAVEDPFEIVALIDIASTNAAARASLSAKVMSVIDDAVEAKITTALAAHRIRTYDAVRHCWWVCDVVNGVPTWTVEE